MYICYGYGIPKISSTLNVLPTKRTTKIITQK